MLKRRDWRKGSLYLMGVWNEHKLLSKLSIEMVDHIRENIQPPIESKFDDVP